MTLETTVNKLPHTGLTALIASLDIPGKIQLPDGSTFDVGTGEPRYKVIFRSESALNTPMTEMAVGHAYVAGDIQIEGDLMALFDARQSLPDKVPFQQKLRFLYDYFRTATSMNAEAVGEHYTRGDDLYLKFIDERFRFYSHGLFQHPDESIEDASEHKLEVMFKALDLKPGMKLLDIGGGWGGVAQYCGVRGVHVTSLTLTAESARFIEQVISDHNVPCRVFRQDFLTYELEPEEGQYDHIVIFGVIEHLPDYSRFAQRVWDMLKPGGRIYLDGSAAVTKYAVSAWTRKHIWSGTHTFMTVQDVMAEFLYHGFEIVEVVRETKDYQWTMEEWARRLERGKGEVIAGWGEETYNVFRLYLWGGAHAFKTNSLQAYHMVAEKTASRGPRPSVYRRIVQFLGNLR